MQKRTKANKSRVSHTHQKLREKSKIMQTYADTSRNKLAEAGRNKQIQEETCRHKQKQVETSKRKKKSKHTQADTCRNYRGQVELTQQVPTGRFRPLNFADF